LKHGKKCGRNIGDMSFCQAPHLNGRWAKLEAARMWGDIVHPTINEIAIMVLDYWEKVQITHPDAKWSDLVLWKMDLKGAYTLIDVLPEEVGMFAQELTQELVYFHLCGVFGWSCTPAAFQVVTRAIKWELKYLLEGLAEMYVDDLIGVCLFSMLHSELGKATSVCTGLLGPDSISLKKIEWGTRLDIIGWVIDLQLMRLSVARKNLLKTIYNMFTINLEVMTDLRELERVASYSQRYVLVCKVLSPFQACFNRMIQQHWHKTCRFHWSPEAKIAIRMWRAMLYLVSVDEAHYTKSLHSFRPKKATFTIETDGSLEEVGFLVKKIGPDGVSETCYGGGAVSIAQYGFLSDSRYQNTSEFIGAIMGIIALVKMGGRDVGIKLKGDSVTALKWGREDKIKGEEALNAGIVMSAICVRYGIEIVDTDFQKGVDNWRADLMSRREAKGWTVRGVLDWIGCHNAEAVDIQQDPAGAALIKACNPKGGCHEGNNSEVGDHLLKPNPDYTCGSEGQFAEFWAILQEATKDIVVQPMPGRDMGGDDFVEES
jgi:hypothetical protein